MPSDPKREPLLSPSPADRASGASTLQATVSLVKICVGTGVMALPWAFVQGASISLPGLAVLVAWNWYTSFQLLACRAAAGPLPQQRSAYSALAHAGLGKAGVYVLEGSLLLVLIGVCASMQIQSAQLLAAVAPFSYTVLVLGGALVVAPLALQRTLRGISAIAAAGLLVLGVGLATVAGAGMMQYGLPPPTAAQLAPPSADGFAAFFGIAAFSFGTQCTILPVQDGMRQPRRAGTALAASLLVVTMLYACVGVALALIYAHASGGVRPLIIMNLTPGSAEALVVEVCSALVALLSYPLPLMPVMQLLAGLVQTSGEPAAADGGAGRDRALRLALLVGTTAIALAVPDFARIASVLGCLNIAFSQLLPPLLHLRLRSLRMAPGARRTAHVAADTVLVALGGGCLLYFGAANLAALRSR